MLKYFFLLLSALFTFLIEHFTNLTFSNDWYFLILIFIGLYILVTAFYFVVIYLISLTINTKKEYTRTTLFHKWILDQTIQLLCELGRVKIKVFNKEIVPNKEKYLLVYNHKSNFDPMIESVVLKKHNLIHISKSGNFKIPIAGPFIRRNCYLEINREDPRKAITTINKAAEFISSGYASIGVSPEGTRNKGDGLLPFKPGCFKIAFKSKCPIVVCSFRNTEKIHKNFPLKRTKVVMKVLKVIEYSEYSEMTTVELAEMTEKIIANDLNITINRGDN